MTVSRTTAAWMPAQGLKSVIGLSEEPARGMPVFEIGAHRHHAGRAGFAEGVDEALAQVGQEGRGDERRDLVSGHQFEGLEGGQVGVVDAVPEPGAGCRLLGGGVGADDDFLGQAAAGVDVHRPAEVVDPADQGGEAFRFDHPGAGVVGLALVGLVHLGGAVADAAVGHQLDAFETEQIVAEAAHDASGGQATLDLVTVVGDVFGSLAKTPGGEEHLGPDGEDVLLGGAVEGADLAWVEAGLGDAGQPEGVVRPAGGGDGGDLVLLSRFGDGIEHQALGAGVEEAGGLAVLIALERPAVFLMRQVDRASPGRSRQLGARGSWRRGGSRRDG